MRSLLTSFVYSSELQVVVCVNNAVGKIRSNKMLLKKSEETNMAIRHLWGLTTYVLRNVFLTLIWYTQMFEIRTIF